LNVLAGIFIGRSEENYETPQSGENSNRMHSDTSVYRYTNLLGIHRVYKPRLHTRMCNLVCAMRLVWSVHFTAYCSTHACCSHIRVMCIIITPKPFLLFLVNLKFQCIDLQLLAFGNLSILQVTM